MAHTIELPVEIRFEIEPIKYLAGSVRLRKWLLQGSRLSWTISAPEQSAGLWCDSNNCAIHVSDLPSSVQQPLMKAGDRLSAAAKTEDLDGLLCLWPSGCNPHKRPKPRPIDAWQLRDDFLHLKHSSDALLEFLHLYGKWSEKTSPAMNSRYIWVPGFIFEAEIWQKQAFVKNALKGDPGQWVETHGFRLRPRSSFPHFVHTASDCLRAIVDSITVDFLRRVPFRICKRPDCGTPFAADRRGKEYCSQYCAHVVSVRRTRSEQKKLRSTERNH